ncbi:hypothetical protein FKW77_007967 [Venturia effusa]|uniref:Mid2 domain-containing protein n=1 Tax=Venturia effusa TaxID=50376 RepID=A0A517KWW6_9PEZI|nr:hypothetical protein FKW77_007967 [Venturia effusa]
MADLIGRRNPSSLNGRDLSVDMPLQPVHAVIPREPQITPAMADGAANVFTTVLYPSVPTEAPTANVVPIFITYTGTLVPTEVPGGFQWSSPASVPATIAPTTPQNTPTVVNWPTASRIMPAIVHTSMAMPTNMLPSSMSMPSSWPTSLPIPTSFWTSWSSSMTSSSSLTSSSTSSSTVSTPSSTSSSSTTMNSSTLSTSTTASNTLPADPTGTGLSNMDEAQETHRLSTGSIAGVVIGVVGAVILFVALAIFLWSRIRGSKRPESPGVYPEEAYLYDPPITPPRGPGSGGNDGDIGRALSPARPGEEREGLITGATVAAGGIGAAAARRGRSGSEARSSQQRQRYSPIESQEMAERNFTVPLAGSSHTQPGPSTNQDPFADPRYEVGPGTAGAAAAAAASSSSDWPLDPDADAGLGSPPRTASTRPPTRQPTRLSTGRPSTSRSRAATPSTIAGPSISGVGSPKYDRRLSGGNPGLPPSNTIREVIPSPHLRELRRAWGVDR